METKRCSLQGSAGTGKHALSESDCGAEVVHPAQDGVPSMGPLLSLGQSILILQFLASTTVPIRHGWGTSGSQAARGCRGSRR